MIVGYLLFLLQQIQKNAKLKSHPDRENITNSVSNVLAACQEYMRKREVNLYCGISLNHKWYTLYRMSVVLLACVM